MAVGLGISDLMLQYRVTEEGGGYLPFPNLTPTRDHPHEGDLVPVLWVHVGLKLKE